MVDNGRIAKNAVLLYIRMTISILVSLYTSRIVLQVLGVEDFGIYGVVGGVISAFGFLTATMSGATSRFITYELGRGDLERLRDTFCSALNVHVIIALIVMLFGETIGLWLVVNKLVIPEGRSFAAMWVYQLSILSAAVSITQTPYTASLIAHERMDAFAYIEILKVILKLLIVYLLLIGSFDKLILYAVLTFAVTLLISRLYIWYCTRNFTDCKYRFVYRKELLRPMLQFSGWDLFGNMGGMIKHQGLPIVLNMFFGPVANAAASISLSVVGSINSLSTSVSQAFRPQIIKCYAQDNISDMGVLIIRSISFTSLLLALLALPLVSEMHFVLNIWLGEVPKYSVEFCQIAIFISVLGNLNSAIIAPIHATGNIQRLSLLGGSIYFVDLIVVYLFMRFLHFPAYSVFLIDCLFMLIILVVNSIILKLLITKLDVMTIWLKIIPICSTFLIVFYLNNLVGTFFSEGWLQLLVVFLFSTVISVIFFAIFVINRNDRSVLIGLVLNPIKKRKLKNAE